MLKTEEYLLDGTRFTTTQYPAMHGLELLAKLATNIGPALAVLQSADQDADLMAMIPRIAASLSGLKPEVASQLVIDILAGTVAYVTSSNGQQAIVQLNSRASLDLVFSSKLKSMFSVIAHAIKVNFSDFNEGSAPAAPLTPALSGV